MPKKKLYSVVNLDRLWPWFNDTVKRQIHLRSTEIINFLNKKLKVDQTDNRELEKNLNFSH